MKILVINPIMYTSETKRIKRASSIKDTMMYDFCLAFHEMGHEVILIGGEPFKPSNTEVAPFKIIWYECKLQQVFMPHCLPYMPKLKKYLKQHRNEFDLIITSEVFSVNSFTAYRLASSKVIIWHELAKHNAKFKQIPSKIWYGIVARVFMKNAKIVPRSVEAREFIGNYCKNVECNVVDHGVNLNKFKACTEKSNSFVVCSQLIERKKIDGIIEKFAIFLKKYDSNYTLYIIGSGELEEQLKFKVSALNVEENVIFTGKLTHEQLMPILINAKALLVNTIKDNNMVSIVESIAVGTPILTTDVPLNSTYIKKYGLGIAKKKWDEFDLLDIVENNDEYVKNCMAYRENLSTANRAERFIEIALYK